MTETVQTPDAATVAREAAQTERGHLLADAVWRERAMVPNSREFASLQQLNLTIAGASGEQDEQGTQGLGSEAPQVPQLREGQVGPPPLPSYEPPASPTDYELPPTQGLQSDPQAESAWRAGMHAAGVDGELAGVAWMVTGDATLRDISAEVATRERAHAEQVLRGRWGAQFDERMALASQEAKRFYAALPATLKAGPGLETYESFMGETGLGRSATVFQMLADRAMKRRGS